MSARIKIRMAINLKKTSLKKCFTWENKQLISIILMGRS